ncbi:MAG: FtsX-like permease family protein [Candidatus Bathyarchaeia archaeon]
MISYAVKRIFRSFGLFAALLLGVILASSFFAGINIGADTTARAALLQQLERIPVDISVDSSSTISSSDWKKAANDIRQVEGVRSAEVISRLTSTIKFDENYTVVMVAAISSTSIVYKGLNIVNGEGTLGVNETYVWVGSKAANKMKLGDIITLNLTYYSYRSEREETFAVLSLMVMGFVELDDKAYSIATGKWSPPIMILRDDYRTGIFHGDLLLIISWEETFARILDDVPKDIPYYSLPFSTQILVYVDRERFINPWDIPSSMEAFEKVKFQIGEKVAKYSGMYVTDNLGMALMTFYTTSITMRFAFIIVALPVFFVAWYVGSTVSDVSYNLRRREIGLLLTKGFSNAQLFRLFLTESIIIGILGGLVGVGLGFAVAPYFAATSEGMEMASPVLSMEIIILTVIFGLAITLLSTFRPSRKAAKLPAVEALREYTYIEEVKPYKQRWPWVAFALGLYKIVMFLFGINLAQVFAVRPPPFTNIFLLILLAIWIVVDSILTYIGPLLFFWGFTKIFIRGSLKFQELAARAAKFLGDLGTLATKNVQRNPARAASIAFLVALIVGYSFQTIGGVASTQDYNIRRIKADVGADMSVSLSSTANLTKVLEIIENIAEITSTTVQYSISGSFPDGSSRQIIAVDPETWLSTAYYEDDWFGGKSAAEAFQLMKMKNQTIILERNVASRLNKRVEDTVMVTIGSSTLELEVVGFFGREVPQEFSWRTFPSYIPIGLYKQLNLDWQSSTTILVKLKANADGAAVASEIRKINGVNSVRSVAEELEELQSNLLLVGPLNIQSVGVVFAILAASVAVGLATLVSLQERKKEASIMWSRGLSFKQLLIMLLTENMAVVTFAAVLGTVVGLIVVNGNIAASNSALAYTLVRYRMVFPLDAITLLASCLILIFASTIIPTLLLTKRYISKVERIVRI